MSNEALALNAANSHYENINQDFVNDSNENSFMTDPNENSQISNSSPNGSMIRKLDNRGMDKLEPEYFRKVFVGSLNYNTNEESLRSHFERFGELVDCVIMKESKTGKSRGFGFVTYSKSSMVDEMMKNRPHKLDGRELETKRATPREESGKPGAEMTTKKLFVGAIREGLNEDHLREYFSKYGIIEDCVVMKEKESNKTRGFGFVTFDDYDPVDKIVLEKNHTVNGQSLAVKKALPKEQTLSGGGGQSGPGYNRNKFNNPNMNRGGPRFNNYNENYYNNSNNYNNRYNNNDYSDDFNSNNFHDNGNGYNNFANNSPGIPAPNPNNMPPQMPGNMPNNFANFAILAQKMLQAGFGAGPYSNPALGMNNNYNNASMMDRNQQMPPARRGGFEGNNRGGGLGPMRDGANNRRPVPYPSNGRKPR